MLRTTLGCCYSTSIPREVRKVIDTNVCNKNEQTICDNEIVTKKRGKANNRGSGRTL